MPKKNEPQTTHWAVELYERFLSLSKNGEKILSGIKKEHQYARGSMAGGSRQAAECAADLYLWAPSSIKKKIRERQNDKR